MVEPDLKPKDECRTKADHRPLLISKLRYIGDESVAWVIRPGFLGQNGALPMRYRNADGLNNNAGAANPIEPGQLFFDEGPAEGRFKFIGTVQRRQINPAINIEEIITFALVEDQKTNKAGTIYEIPSPLSVARQRPHIQYDRSAVMRLGALGQGAKEMVIEEYTFFSLPFGQDEKPYFLKLVTPEQIIVEYTDSQGQKREVTVPKGALPDIS